MNSRTFPSPTHLEGGDGSNRYSSGPLLTLSLLLSAAFLLIVFFALASGG